MKQSRAFLLKCVLMLAALTATISAHPERAPENNVYGNGRIIDISHQITRRMPAYGSPNAPAGDVVQYKERFGDGIVKTQDTWYAIPAHCATHVDAPSHAIPKWEWEGYGVDTLDLETLNGPGLLVDIPRDKNITAEVLESLNLPKDLKRVLFRTANTDRELMLKPFESNYTAVTLDGAEWIAKSNLKLVGIDYISIAVGSRMINFVPPHQVLLEKRDIIPVEALNLANIPTGAYYIQCLPVRLLGADGSPTRCILMQ